ncbi:MAG: hypothetical protein H3C62_13355 [Gemmatimonadaceae bacterium]|nr:hypothetical protein [Gemmatimonadaceae bacterium]
MNRFAAGLLGSLAAAPLTAQPLPVVRPLGPITKVSGAGVLGSVSMVRSLPSGAVIVNDVTRRQLVLLDANLVKKKTIADTSLATGKSYGSALGGLMAFRGDSSLFIDPSTLGMLVVDADGEVARVLAVPRLADVNSMIGGPFGTPALDPRERIVCRNIVRAKALAMNYAAREKSVLKQQTDDSALVYRINLATRAVDTVAWVKVPVARATMSETRQGGLRVVETTNPLPVVDDWALLPDGRVAIVRGADFHVDWIDLDGRSTSSPKIPHPWERLTDDAKEKLLDSLKADVEQRREALRKAGRDNAGPSARSIIGHTNAAPFIIVRGQLASDVGRAPPPPTQIVSEFVPAKDLPDYRPAFRIGATRADLAGNLWVRTTTPSDAGAVYDVIDGRGRLVDRVKVPFGRVISGFGPGVVYLGVLDEKGARLEKANIR